MERLVVSQSTSTVIAELVDLKSSYVSAEIQKNIPNTRRLTRLLLAYQNRSPLSAGKASRREHLTPPGTISISIHA